MSAESKSKDIWDKLEIITSVISGVVLVAAVIVLDTGARRIAHSLQSGQLVQTLIADLSAPDTTVRQGIALVTLDRSVGDHNPAMLTEICEHILENGAFDQLTGHIAFEIIQRRDPRRARQIRAESQRELRRAQLAQAIGTDTLAPDRSERSGGEVEPDWMIQPRQAQLSSRASKVLSNVVFVQFSPERRRTEVRKLVSHLEDRGFNMPGIEHIDANYASSVRYFHEGDRLLADSLAQLTRSYFEAQKRSLEIPPQFIAGYQSRVPRGQLEVWLRLKRAE